MTPTLSAPGLARAAAALLAAALALACEPGGEAYAGRFVSGFETSAFYPCGSDEQWWLTADSTSWARLHRPPARRDTAGYVEVRAFVRVRGRATPPGEYGHVGAYNRELTVTEVLAVRDPDAAGCP